MVFIPKRNNNMIIEGKIPPTSSRYVQGILCSRLLLYDASARSNFRISPFYYGFYLCVMKNSIVGRMARQIVPVSNELVYIVTNNRLKDTC